MTLSLKLHKTAVKLLVRPYLWASQRKKQNPITRSIRATWRKL